MKNIYVLIIIALLIGCTEGPVGEAVEHADNFCNSHGGIERLMLIKRANVDMLYKLECKDGSHHVVSDKD